MNQKTLLLLLLLAALPVAMAEEQVVTAHANDKPSNVPHWAPAYGATCDITLWWGGTVKGIQGHRSDGSSVCYVPRVRRALQNKVRDALSQGGFFPPGQGANDPPVNETPGNDTAPANDTQDCTETTIEDCRNVTSHQCHQELRWDPPVCTNYTLQVCNPPVCNTTAKCVCDNKHENEGNHYGECKKNKDGCSTIEKQTCEPRVCHYEQRQFCWFGTAHWENVCEDNTRRVCEEVTQSTCTD
jgi:hypothetical protein